MNVVRADSPVPGRAAGVQVSVHVITYNQAKFIREALESVLDQQTNFGYEVFVGDDFSTDGTREIIQGFADAHPTLIKPIFQDQNTGGRENYFRTLNACRAPFVAFLEGDDYWTDSSKLQRQVEALKANPNWSMCIHPVPYVDEEGNEIGHAHPPDRLPEYTWRDACRFNPVQTCSAVIRRAAIPGMLPGWFYEAPALDWPLALCASLWGPIGLIDRDMARYRRHPGGVWSSMPLPEGLQKTIELYELFERNFREPILTELIKGRLHYEGELKRLLA